MVKTTEVVSSMLKKTDYLLILEDSIAESHLLKEAFRLNDFKGELKFIHSGKSLLSLLEHGLKEYPRIILLDLKLQDMDGIEILQWINDRSNFKDIPVIIRTVSRNPRDKQRCLDLGAHDFIIKSMDFNDLEKQVIKIADIWNAL